MAYYLKKSAGSWIFDIFNIVLLILFTCVFLYPFVYVFSISISDTYAVARGEVKLFPIGFDFTSYSTVLHDNMILLAYYNTILYSVIYSFLVLLLTSLTAYPLSLNRFYGRKVITVFFILTMYIGGGLIPSYLLMKYLHLTNTLWAIVLPGSLQAWYLILFRTSFHAVPMELKESAHIDGASQWRILFQIVLPLSKPILATIALFSLIAQWNNFFAPFLYLNDEKKAPLQLVLRKLIIRNSAMSNQMFSDIISSLKSTSIDKEGYFESLKMAAIMVSIGPIILVYPFVQKYFVKGTLIGSIKG